jgi:hypothetical protein
LIQSHPSSKGYIEKRIVYASSKIGRTRKFAKFKLNACKYLPKKLMCTKLRIQINATFIAGLKGHLIKVLDA